MYSSSKGNHALVHVWLCMYKKNLEKNIHNAFVNFTAYNPILVTPLTQTVCGVSLKLLNLFFYTFEK